MDIRRTWRHLARLGVPPGLDPSAAKHIIFCNMLALFLAPFTALSVVPPAVLGQAAAATLLALWALFYCLPLAANALGRYRTARTGLLLIALAQVITEAVILGSEGERHYLALIIPVAAFVLYPPKERPAMLAAAAAGVAAVFALDFGTRGMTPVVTLPPSMMRMAVIGGVAKLAMILGAIAYFSRTSVAEAEAALEAERQKSEALLLNILPAPIAARLRNDHQSIADGHANVTVIFADIVGFTALSARKSPQEVVYMLNDVFSTFDDLAGQFGLEKIKTIGDAYMAVSGLPVPRADHAAAAARMALAMAQVVARYRERTGEPLALRVGVHSGPVVAGVIGKRKFIYDLWGDTVNTASRMESHGMPDRVQVSEPAYHLLKDAFDLEARGTIEVKGKGAMATYWLHGARETG